ncbi:PD-(D/E)XK nuclease family protein [Runella zeae]|uniref:PD-(D/E)XK nuclease family protein n=1 Tax=Runella zeae TaxID=94255 RepID=UPI002355098E|nr:PD-(D/E)XK nuclease family protein [Runella zeae]
MKTLNFFDALNQGDASLKEAHLTSLLFYLFKETYTSDPQNSLISFFLSQYLGHSDDDYISRFDVETDLKVEQILQFEGKRRDCDITIHLKYPDRSYVVNIENKINTTAYQPKQISEQEELLKRKYPEAVIKNVLILPYKIEAVNFKNQIARIIYWFNDECSLVNVISSYLEKSSTLPKALSQSFMDFFNAFGDNLEQTLLADEKSTRGPKNKYAKSMYEYLSTIAQRWESYFTAPDDVKVKDLLEVFERIVKEDIEAVHPVFEVKAMLDKFRRGALEAQPKIMTINEKNRIHFNIADTTAKRLFYYPDYPNGDYNEKWREVRIKPLKNMTESKDYLVIWKEKKTGETKTQAYKRGI